MGFRDLDPENAESWSLYFRLQDQQRAGGFDVLGLDYAVLPVVFDVYGIPQADRRAVFEDLCVINSEMQKYRARKRETEQQFAKLRRSQSRSR